MRAHHRISLFAQGFRSPAEPSAGIDRGRETRNFSQPGKASRPSSMNRGAWTRRVSCDAKIILEVGENGWQFPFPLVKDGLGWRFDIEAGKEEMLNRRIGQNDLSTIEAVKAYVDAQREYYLANQQKDKISSYAQKFLSTPNQRDGLYYPVEPGEQASPLGELYAKAQASRSKSEQGSARQAYSDILFAY